MSREPEAPVPKPGKPRKRRPTREMTDPESREIRRLWGDLEVIDATYDLPTHINACDVEGANRKDPSGCVFARACRRTYGATKVLFFRTVAYVDLPDDEGTRHVHRFEVDKKMRKLIVEFDRGRRQIPPSGFLLKKPRPSERLDAKRKICRARGQEWRRRRRMLIGTAIGGDPGPAKATRAARPLVVDLVRNGSGAVHFNRCAAPESDPKPRPRPRRTATRRPSHATP